MIMHKITQEYLHTILKTQRKVLYGEFDFLRKKNKAYQEKDFEGIKNIVEEQQELYHGIIPHMEYFMNHQSHIARELFGIDIELKQKERLEEVLLKEDFLIRFSIDQKNHVDSIFKKQLKALNRREEGIKGKITRVYHKGTKTQLHDYLQKEEELFSWYLELSLHKSKTIEKEYIYQKRHRAYDTLKDYVLDASVAITSIPLGPLELLSVPFWGLYFSMHELEHLNSHFEEWRRVNKNRIIQ